MPLLAPPPNLSVAAGRDFLRPQRGVLYRVPLRRQCSVLGGQIIEARYNAASAAIGAAFSRRPGVDGSFPAVPLLAPPPDLPCAAVGDRLGRQIPIQFRVPFSQQVFVSAFSAKIIKSYSHVFKYSNDWSLCSFGFYLSFPRLLTGIRFVWNSAGTPHRLPCGSGYRPDTRGWLFLQRPRMITGRAPRHWRRRRVPCPNERGRRWLA